MNSGVQHIVVEPASDDDGTLVALLVRAYADEPLMNWAFRDDDRREVAWAAYFREMLKLYRATGLVFTNPQRTACALWATPGNWRISRALELKLAPTILRMLGFRRLRRGLRLMHRLQAEHPEEPHYYLNLVGVEPSLQGGGIGSSLIRAGLDRADAAGLGAYLETAQPRNVPLYERHGFRTSKLVEFGQSSPQCWLMWRPPHGSGDAANDRP
jgi:GNAT superfamily N-acetyltransferase